ncbi:MAG TPA: anthranilate phosphoribosyltransferase [Stellaceae bacterium]|jgi:anthranilate phosphoribosyltransferase|nr:anthranilate phosphoribosyltransferase [Stellaceae bacterium]
MTEAAPDFRALLAKVATGRQLSEAEAAAAFDAMMSGDATPSQMGGFLMALRVRGETVEEITGAARTMRAKALKVAAPQEAIDIVGTGGDGQGSFNISSAAALVVAGCGVPVAKHGNRKASSLTGAADVLEALGVNINCDLSLVERAIAEAGIGFLMAQRHHSAMRHVAPTRVELGTRTIFNLLGPIANPAGVTRQLVGVFSRDWVKPIAEVLAKLGTERAWVVHGDGLDELTTTGTTHVAELKGGKVASFDVTPEDAGLPRARLDDIKGADPATNAARMVVVLEGRKGPLRDIVLLNAAAALVVAGRAKDLREGVAEAARSIDSGAAKRALERLIAITNIPVPA